jgi:hypothetical protein
MNRPSKQTYYNDLVFQGLFYVPMMFSYVIGFIAPGAFFIGIILQFFVGCTQVFSGVFHSARYEDQVHKTYLTIAIGYLMFLFLGGMGLSNFSFTGSDVLLVLCLFIIPVGIATWYYRLTWLAYKNADEFMDQEYTKQAFQEDVLDDMML